MNKLVATTYPTRYEALDHPRVWVQHVCNDLCGLNGRLHRGGYEYAVYYDPRPGVIMGHPDGIYIAIISDQGRAYQLDAHAIRPARGREQMNQVALYADYSAAEAAAFDWLAKAEAFVEATGGTP